MIALYRRSTAIVVGGLVQIAPWPSAHLDVPRDEVCPREDETRSDGQKIRLSNGPPNSLRSLDTKFGPEPANRAKLLERRRIGVSNHSAIWVRPLDTACAWTTAGALSFHGEARLGLQTTHPVA